MPDPWSHFSPDMLARVCELPEAAFGAAFDLERYTVDQPAPDDFYFFRDAGARVLAVAHLDTVGRPETRRARFTETEGGLVVHSRALDDRLGAYIILDLLPALGITTDVLLTMGEESGRSTAQFFDAPRQYDYMIEFDRGGTDVVMYQYDDDDSRNLVRAAGARVGDGSYSDIADLDHLGCKGYNWGIGYRDYHGPRAHAYLDDTLTMVSQYLVFHEANAGIPQPHAPARDLHGASADLDGWWNAVRNHDEDRDILDPNDPFYWRDGWARHLS